MRKLIKMSAVFAAAATILSLGAFNSTAWAKEVEINEENFPDENFRNYLLEYIDDGEGNGDGKLSDGSENTELTIETINVSDSGISNLKGIEYFTELSTLVCSENDLTSLSLSENKKLDLLDCSHNQLTSLDLSANTALTELRCSNNSLSGLDLKKNTGLITLFCENNKLTSLDLSKLAALEELHCGNYYDDFPDRDFYNGIELIDLSYDNALTTLDCEGLGLSALDLSGSKDLAVLVCRDNSLTELDLSNNVKLKEVYCSNNKLTSLNVDNLSALEELYYNNRSEDELFSGNFNSITSIDLSHNGNLTYLDCSNNGVTGIDVSHNTALEYLFCDSNKLTSIDVSKNTALFTLSVDNNMLTDIDLSKNVSLWCLYCSENQLTKLDLKNNKELDNLFCYENRLTELDLSKNKAIKELDCSDNMIKKLDVSTLSNLVTFDCSNNEMETLILGDKASPREQSNKICGALNCENNKLTELELDSVPNVTYLYCDHNNLTSLDLSALNHLDILHCDHNALTSLDLSKNLYLSNMTCSHNRIKKLELRKEKKPDDWYEEELEEEEEETGEIEGEEEGEGEGEDYWGEPEIDGAVALYTAASDEEEAEDRDFPYIDCSFNELESLDVSHMDELEVLNCFRNKYLKAPDVTGNKLLKRIYGNGNAFDSMNVTGLNIVKTDGTLSKDKKSISFNKYDPDDPMFDDPEDPNSGDQKDPNSGDQKDTNSGDQKDTNSGDQKDPNSGDQKDTNSGDQKDTNSDDQKDSNSGDQKDSKSDDQKDSNSGDPKDSNSDDPEDSKSDDPENQKSVVSGNTGVISPKKAAEKAANENKGSVNDTVVLQPSGKKFALDYEGVSQNEAVITVAKGNSFSITGNLKDFKSDSPNVKVNNKGLVKAKKATGDTPAVLTFSSASGETSYKLKVYVNDPAENLETLSGNAVVEKMKIKASANDTIQDISMKGVPLNAEVGAVVDKKGASQPLPGRDSIFGIGDDGFFHLAAELTGNKGKVKLPLKINGKKFIYNLKIK